MINLHPKYKKEIDQRIKQLNTLYTGKDAIYISSPITTGKNYLHWYINVGKQITNKNEFDKLHRKEVISKNEDIIKTFTANLRTKTKEDIIEPASLVVPIWTQDDYLYYWGEIISKYVKKIVCLNGWNYSNGCIYEYYIGLKNNLTLVNQNFQLLNHHKAIVQIKESIQECEKTTINVEFQKSVLSEIEKYEYKEQ